MLLRSAGGTAPAPVATTFSSAKEVKAPWREVACRALQEQIVAKMEQSLQPSISRRVTGEQASAPRRFFPVPLKKPALRTLARMAPSLLVPRITKAHCAPCVWMALPAPVTLALFALGQKQGECSASGWGWSLQVCGQSLPLLTLLSFHLTGLGHSQ